jgi:hypothetical protein
MTEMEVDVNSVVITLREYKSLMDDSEMLRHLYAAGVQDWDGYEIALKEMER